MGPPQNSELLCDLVCSSYSAYVSGRSGSLCPSEDIPRPCLCIIIINFILGQFFFKLTICFTIKSQPNSCYQPKRLFQAFQLRSQGGSPGLLTDIAGSIVTTVDVGTTRTEQRDTMRGRTLFKITSFGTHALCKTKKEKKNKKKKKKKEKKKR